ncbi:hypothetical protein SK128_025169, partial [Halocaridina rubra]
MAPRTSVTVEVNSNGKRAKCKDSLGCNQPMKCRSKRSIAKCGNQIFESMGMSSTNQTVKLFNAVEGGNLSAVKNLIQETGPAVRQAKTCCTLLHTAAKANRTDIAAFLLKFIHPTVVNTDNQTPCHLAAMHGHLEVLQILLSDRETNHNLRDVNGKTYRDFLAVQLFKAVLWWKKFEIEKLLTLGADPDYDIGKMVHGTVSRELNVKTTRQLANALGRDSIVQMFPE